MAFHYLLLAFCIIFFMPVNGRENPQPFAVAEGLFDHTETETLGLEFAPDIETFPVFRADDSTRKYNHAAVLIAFKGRLFAQWQSSAVDEDAPDTRVVYSVSETGKTWSGPGILASSRDNALVTNGGWWTDGDLLVAYLNVWPHGQEPKAGYVEYMTSVDGQHWSEPRRLTLETGDFVNGVIEQDVRSLPRGRLLTAIHLQPGLVAKPFYTDDPRGLGGWKVGEIINLPHQPEMSRELEPSWFLKRNGRIVMIFRDQGSSFRVLASESRDNGATWSTPVPTGLPDSRAKQSAGNLPDGSAFIVNNPSGTRRRVPLVLTLSNDGNVFDRAFLLRAGGDNLPEQKFSGRYKSVGYSYPKSIVWQDFVYVSYAVNKEDIAITRVPVSGLSAGVQ